MLCSVFMMLSSSDLPDLVFPDIISAGLTRSADSHISSPYEPLCYLPTSRQQTGLACTKMAEARPVVRLATADDRAQIVPFIDAARKQIFPLLADQPLPKDLANFNETYIDGPGRFFVAHGSDGQLVAGVGYVPYDHRFPQLDHRHTRTVEVIRLFVVPEHRRSGLASELFGVLRLQAMEDIVECLYLHTHPFLPGAIGFWERQGFRITDIEADPDWRTTHMELKLSSP